MRWPFRRATDGTGDTRPGAAAAGAAAAHSPAGGGTAGPHPDPATPDPGWSALPPLRSTWHAAHGGRAGARSPLTVPATEPAVPLTREPARVRPRAAAGSAGAVDPLAPEPGRIAGLAAVRPPAPVLPVVAPAQFPEQPPLRHVSARPVTEHAPLTRATDDYVSEPVAPAPPPPPAAPAPTYFPASPPRADPQVEAGTDAGARFREALANLHRSGLPEYRPGGDPDPSGGPVAPPAPPPAAESWSRPEPAAAPPAPRGPDPALTHRRNTLAQSRRLGLGAPLRRDEPGAPGAADRDDAAADAEPARGTPELRHPPAPAAPSLPPVAPVAALPPASPAVAAPLPAALPPAPPAPAPVPPPAAELPAQHAETTPAPEPESPADAHDGDARPRPPLQPVTVVAQPISDGTARPTAATTPLVYRARPADDAARGAAVRAEVERAVVTRAPAELAAALRSTHGIDVGEVPVRRDTDAGREADGRRARAFTRGGTVYLPESAGAVDTARARGLLAHELVHAAQQRRLGGTLPGSHTPEGRALEAEAVAAERMYSSTPSTRFEEPELVHAPVPVSAGWVDERIVQLAGDPVDYLDSSTQLTATMREDFRDAADEAVSQVVESFGGTYSGDVSAGDAASAEQSFLDVINAELDKRGEPPQAALSTEDSEKVQNMLKKGPAQAQVDVVRSSQASRWQQETFGNSMALGGDFAGIAGWFGWGKQDSVDVVDQSKGSITHVPTPGGAGPDTSTPAGGPAQPGAAASFLGTMFGTSPGAPGTAAGPRGDGRPGATGTAAQTAAPSTTGGVSLTAQRPAADTLAGFAANMFGAEAVLGAQTAGGGAVDPVTGRPATGSTAQRAHVGAPGGIDAVTGLPKDHQYGDPLDLADTDEENLDDLVTRIYDRLRSRLRRDLIVDRERAGLLTDFR